MIKKNKRTSIELSTLTEEHKSYLIKCARIRDISVSSLMGRLVTTIANDQMCEAILDDGGARVARGPREHRYQSKREYPF